MIRIYEKTHKSSTNLHGVKEIQNNPLLDSPCMLCISSEDSMPKSVFGIIREGMRVARLRTRIDDAARYDLDNFPAKFLGITHSKEKLSDDYIKELAERLFVSLFCPDNKKRTIEEAKKKARNVTIMAYCEGATTYLEIEKYTIKKMLEFGYQETEIREILEQQCIVAIDTDANIKDLMSTCIEFHDINDSKLEKRNALEVALANKTTKHLFGRYNNNTGLYYYSGTGDHCIKSYFSKDDLAGVSLSAVVTESISNSIANHANPEMFKPISLITLYERIKEILEKANNNITPQELMKQLDRSINYSNAKILTLAECRRLSEIDSLCNMILKLQEELNSIRKTEL